jgi:phage terminase large subunit GpA-like protein
VETSRPNLFSVFALLGLLGVPHFPDAVGRGQQHGQASDGGTHAGSRAGQWQQVRDYQHHAKADGANTEKDGGGRGHAAGRRLQGRRTGVFLHGSKIASGPLILDGEHGQRQRYYYQARPGCDQEHRADGEDHRAYHGDRDPAEQPNRVLHLGKHAQHTAGATTSTG